MERPAPISDLRLEWHSVRVMVLRRLWTVLAVGLFAFCCLFCYDRCFHTHSYSSYATLAVQAIPGEAGPFANLASASAMAEQYAFVFESDPMRQLILAELAQDQSPATLTAEVTSDINLLTLHVTASTPTAAEEYLSAVLRVHPRITDELFSNATLQLVEVSSMPARSNGLSGFLFWLVPALAALAQCLLLVLWALLRPTVRLESAFQQFPSLPYLGTICHSKYSPLLFQEDLKKLATRLEAAAHSHDATVFSVTAAASKEGCSTVSLHVAAELARRGHTVALLTAHPPVSAPQERLSLFQFPASISTLSTLRDTHSFVIADIPAYSDVTTKAEFWSDSDYVLLVIKANSTTVSSIQALLDTIPQVGGRWLGGVINQVYPAIPKRLIPTAQTACAQGGTPHANNHSSCSRVHL